MMLLRLTVNGKKTMAEAEKQTQIKYYLENRVCLNQNCGIIYILLTCTVSM